MLFPFLKRNSKAFSLVELLAVISIIMILSSISSIIYIKYRNDAQLQILRNQGDMIAKALLNCMFYDNNSEDCLLGISDDGRAYNLQTDRLFDKIELIKFQEPIQNLKASWDSSSNQRNFCFQFKRELHNTVYKLCVDVDRKTKIIRSMISEKNFCCNKLNGACALPLNPQSRLIGNVSSAHCKNKGYSDDFFSYLSRSGWSQAVCKQGTCIQ